MQSNKDHPSSEVQRFYLDRQRTRLVYTQNDWTYLFIKVPNADDVDFVFTNREYKNQSGMRFDATLEYAGFVSYRLNCCYDLPYPVRQYAPSAELRIDIQAQMADDVLKAILHIVNGKPVPVTDSAEKLWNEERDREYHSEHGAKEQAVSHFYKRTMPYLKLSVVYNDASPEDILAYLHGKDAFVEKEATSYITQHANQINYRLWAMEVTRKELQKISETPGDHYYARAIAEAITDQKTVTLVLDRDEKPFVGKIEATVLKTNLPKYSTYRMPANDRRAYANQFGRHTDLFARDIVCIEYKGKPIYERQNVKQPQ